MSSIVISGKVQYTSTQFGRSMSVIVDQDSIETIKQFKSNVIKVIENNHVVWLKLTDSTKLILDDKPYEFDYKLRNSSGKFQLVLGLHKALLLFKAVLKSSEQNELLAYDAIDELI